MRIENFGTFGSSEKINWMHQSKSTDNFEEEDESSELINRSKDEVVKVSHASCFILVKHSRMYLMWSILCMFLTISLIIWIIVDHGAVHNVIFVVLEFVVTGATIFDLLLLISELGIRGFFCGAKEDQSNNSYCQKYGWIFINYGQLLLVILCIAGSVTTTISGSNWESDMFLGLLMIRYLVMLVLFSINHHRSMSAQGGMKKAIRGNGIDSDWDVTF